MSDAASPQSATIYAQEVEDMITEGRFRSVPYDPDLPVHRVWDDGWDDARVVIMVQKPHPTVVNIINFYDE